VQIAFGAFLAVMTPDLVIELEPEIFMVLVIGPLLFREAEESDLISLWSLKKQVFLMAFLLVFLTVAAVGFSVHWLVPAIPTAACFVLGAILGPTDLVAVTSMSSNVGISPKLMTVLKGEGLINDSSGIIAFNFAVIALLTGVFSPVMALGRLIVVALGGFAVGFVVVSIKLFLSEVLKDYVQNTETHIILDLVLPFICYIIAEHLGFSGILAVVTAGSRQALRYKRTNLFEAELGSMRHTVWNAINFTLNSLVFLLLGLQLPAVIMQIWLNPAYPNIFLIFVSIIVTLIVFAVRFLSVIIIAREIFAGAAKEKFKNALSLTFSGVKGAVSLAIAFALPFFYADGRSFAERPLILFITAGVIIISLFAAQIILPLLAKPTKIISLKEKEEELQIAILREVISQLWEQEGENARAVITNYQRRLRDKIAAEYGSGELRDFKQLKHLIYRTEIADIKNAYQKKRLSFKLYRDYHALLDAVYRFAFGNWRLKLHFPLKKNSLSAEENEAHRRDLRELFRKNTSLVIKTLEEKRGQYADKLIDHLIEERRDFTEQVMEGVYGNELRERMYRNYSNEMLKGYYVERRVIHQFFEQNKISAAEANKFRVNVNKLESFSLDGHSNEIMLKIIALTSNRNHGARE
jgi:CPA1 family monovalent cation:H+ antiporter